MWILNKLKILGDLTWGLLLQARLKYFKDRDLLVKFP